MSDGSFALGRIGQIHVSVKDVGRAARFYREALGLPLLFEFPGMAFFDCGGVRLYLAPPEKPEHDRTSLLYFSVPSIDEAAAALEDRGVTFEERPHVVHRDPSHELWMGFFRDSEGNLLALMSEVPAKPA